MPTLVKKIAEVNKRSEENIVWFTQLEKKIINAKTTIPLSLQAKTNSAVDIIQKIETFKLKFSQQLMYIFSIQQPSGKLLGDDSKQKDRIKLAFKFEQLKSVF